MPDPFLGRSGLSWSEAGNAGGRVVVYFHGTPKAVEPFGCADLAEDAGTRLLMADRPGYGRSVPRPHTTFAELGRMVHRDLDDLGVGELSALGWSGGGPHALACAAGQPSRVRAVGLFGSWAPMHPPDRGLPLGVRFAMRVAAALPRTAVRLMLLGRPVGMVDDVRRVARPWGFDVEALAASVPVVAWHSEHDPQVPIGPWRAIGGVDLRVVPGDEHDVSREVWRSALEL